MLQRKVIDIISYMHHTSCVCCLMHMRSHASNEEDCDTHCMWKNLMKTLWHSRMILEMLEMMLETIMVLL